MMPKQVPIFTSIVGVIAVLLLGAESSMAAHRRDGYRSLSILQNEFRRPRLTMRSSTNTLRSQFQEPQARKRARDTKLQRTFRRPQLAMRSSSHALRKTFRQPQARKRARDTKLQRAFRRPQLAIRRSLPSLRTTFRRPQIRQQKAHIERDKQFRRLRAFRQQLALSRR